MKYTAILDHTLVGQFVEELMFFGDIQIFIRRKYATNTARINFKIGDVYATGNEEFIRSFIEYLEPKFQTLIQPWTETSEDFWNLLGGEVLT